VLVRIPRIPVSSSIDIWMIIGNPDATYTGSISAQTRMYFKAEFTTHCFASVSGTSTKSGTITADIIRIPATSTVNLDCTNGSNAFQSHLT
jgi:hypothetical protein